MKFAKVTKKRFESNFPSKTSSIFFQGTNAGTLGTDKFTEAGKLVNAQLQAKCSASSVTGNIALSFTGNKTQFNFKPTY